MKQTCFVNYRLKYARFEPPTQVGVRHKSRVNGFKNQTPMSYCWNCAPFGFYRLVVYFCTARLLYRTVRTCDFTEYAHTYITNRQNPYTVWQEGKRRWR